MLPTIIAPVLSADGQTLHLYVAGENLRIIYPPSASAIDHTHLRLDLPLAMTREQAGYLDAAASAFGVILDAFTNRPLTPF